MLSISQWKNAAQAQPIDAESSQQALSEETFGRLQVVLAGRYDLLSLVGLGGMSMVYAARRRSNGALFAIKVLRPELTRETNVVARFRREALHAGCLLGHPNIVSVLDVEEADGLLFLTMPYVRGEDLDALLERTGPLPAAEALQAAHHIASALAFAAQRELLHGDLTPGNIRLSEFGRYMVLDFGLSRGQRTRSGSGQTALGKIEDAEEILGTPFYMAPEQIRGERVDGRTDLYSLGATLFHMLVGTPPFVATTLKEISRMHLEQEAELPTTFCKQSPKAAAIVLKLLRKDPAQRFPDAHVLCEALTAAGTRSDAARIEPRTEGQAEAFPPRRRLERILPKNEEPA